MTFFSPADIGRGAWAAMPPCDLDPLIDGFTFPERWSTDRDEVSNRRQSRIAGYEQIVTLACQFLPATEAIETHPPELPAFEQRPRFPHPDVPYPGHLGIRALVASAEIAVIEHQPDLERRKRAQTVNIDHLLGLVRRGLPR